MDELRLLEAYSERQDQEAFTRLVVMHGGWLHSAARRRVRDEHLAEDVTQAVFLLLSRRAGKLRRYSYLSGWLLGALGYCIKQAMSREAAIKRREKESARMRKEAVEETRWEEVAPELDEAVGKLGKSDREAVLLRFYEQRPMAEVGKALGISEDAARKRVERAVERLRGILGKKGISGTTAGLSAVLVGNVVGQMPEGLVEKIVSAVGGGGGSAVAAGIAKGAMKMMTMGALKLVAAAVIGTMVLSGLTLVLARGSASPSLAATAAPSPDRPATAPTTGQTRLPPDLETIVAGWEANAERIRSLSLHGTIRVDSKEYAAATDLEGKSYPGHSGQFMMVRDGDTIRIDTHFDRMFDVASGKVRYQQPYGRLDPRAPTTQMTPATATTSDTMRVLVNGNELTRYWVEANLVLIVPRRTELSQLPERELPQLLYSSPLGETPFRRYIETRQRTGAITVEQAKDGSKVIHWRGRATIADPDRATREMAIILNPNKGYAIESIRPTEGGHPVGEMSYEYVQHNGVWLLVGIKTREWGADGKTLARSAEANVDPTSIKANEPVAPTFSVEALGIADDAHVQDSIRQKAYTYRQMSE